MHNDSAHHANIALHMFTTGDYVSLIDRETEYLDKPHFLFWTAALSYQVFGVSAFAYKITSFLFGILCLYATYRLAQTFYSQQVATFAILILATTYSFLLSFNDVRMDAILTGAITFSIWQLILLSKSQKFKYVVGAALGLSIGFSTKGALGVVIPLIAIVIYLAQENSLRKLLSPKWIIAAAATLAFTLPVLYCYYLQFDLHPENIMKGVAGNSGVAYILFGQSLDRLNMTTSGVQGSKDPFFYLHTLLWTALPWTILGIASLATVVRNRIWARIPQNRNDVFLFLLVTVVIALLSVASSKLPHYLNIIFPFLSILVAASILRSEPGKLKYLRIGQQG
jgi:4-amino-4-deoxy-L-arabinose transferase-like glycosyltransferase